MIRQRDGTTRRRDQHEDDSDSSVKEIGRLLQNGRQERGLDLVTVHDRLGRPITQLEALETGDLAALPDQALALSTLRRYAAFLGLDGDALALRMIDAWSAVPPSPKPSSVHESSTVTNVVTAVTSGPEHLRAFTQTGEVPRVGGSSIGTPAGSGAYGYGLAAAGPPTGTFPVVPKHDLKHSRRAMAKARRRFHAPVGLKVTTWVCGILLVVVAVGYGLLHWNSKALVQAHILRVVDPGAPQSGTGKGAAATTPASPAATKVVLTSTDAQSSSYAVGTGHFTVDLGTSGRCWIQVTSSNSPVPLISGVQPAGEILSYPADGTMTVQVGSSAVKVGIVIAKKTVLVTTPHGVPFTYTFAPASGG